MAVHNISVPSAMDSLSQALGANIIPNQEYLLQGSILDSSVEHLIHRLKGLCDNVDAGPEQFQDHEIVFSLPMPNQPNPLQLRVRKAHDSEPPHKEPFQLRYVGQPEIGMRPTLIRSSLDILCTSSIIEFLTEMGFRIDFEYINRGYMFRKGRMKVTVSKIFKPGPLKPGESFSEPISQSYLVECSVLAATGQDAIGNEMKAFADQLRPLVNLDKIDFKRIANQAAAAAAAASST